MFAWERKKGGGALQITVPFTTNAHTHVQLHRFPPPFSQIYTHTRTTGAHRTQQQQQDQQSQRLGLKLRQEDKDIQAVITRQVEERQEDKSSRKK
jgi:hypothetical protein